MNQMVLLADMLLIQDKNAYLTDIYFSFLSIVVTENDSSNRVEYKKNSYIPGCV